MLKSRNLRSGAAGTIAVALLLVLLGPGRLSAENTLGYDPAADPAASYASALQQAAEQGKLVLLVFGSGWCPDCRDLDRKFTQAPLSETVSGNFVVAHVDIGYWDRNMEFTRQFGEPVAKGIPSIAIVSPQREVLYVSEAGEFASARSAELASLNAWFEDRLQGLRPH